MRCCHWLLLLLIFGVLGSRAYAEPATTREAVRQLYDAALRELRSGSPRTAAVALAAVGESAAESSPALAAEALFRAAQIYTEQLSDPAQAQELYAQTVERYPGSRFAPRAAQRGAELGALRRTDPAVLTEFNDIAAAYMTLGMPTVIARLTRLLADHPGFPYADRATYLLGTAYRDAGPDFRPAAEQTLGRLCSAYPDSPWVPYAHKALADLALRQNNYAGARHHFRALLRYRQPLWIETAQDGLWACACALWRHRSMQACWLYLLVSGGMLGFRARHQLLPPPMEFIYYAPVAAFLLVITFMGNGVYARGTMVGLAMGGSLLAWLSGAAARRPGGLLRGIFVRVLASGAVCYLAIYHGGLLDLLLETWRMGPESG